MANERYFSNFRPDLLSGNIDQMLAENRPEDKTVLLAYLEQALEFLNTEPGPHLDFRRGHVGDWIGWWIKFLESKNDEACGLLVPFDKVKGSLVQGREYGVLFAGGFEGHAGHRFAANWMKQFVNPIFLLERDGYIESKLRGGPYLDLRARVSMWAFYNPNVLASVLPEKPEDVDGDVHYKGLFDQTGANYCFASKSDPLCQQKIARGKTAPFTLIPDVNIQSTSDGVEKLAPDIDFERLNRLINTTDTVEKLMPDVDKD
jgi:hypothetical protein